MNTSADAPYLDCAYKLTEYAGLPRRKRSEGKATWPGRKQVYRRFDARGELAGDVLTLQGDQAPGTALLDPVMVAGQRRLASPGLEASRDHARSQLAALPERLHSFDPAEPYQVEVSAALNALAQAVDARTQAMDFPRPAEPGHG
jgi:nicotinate phosphoribosyltransferase